jgi:hypothetical protein
MFSILGWIIFGLIVGALAKLVMPGRDPGGIIVRGRGFCDGADRSPDPARALPPARRPTRLGLPVIGVAVSQG